MLWQISTNLYLIFPSAVFLIFYIVDIYTTLLCDKLIFYSEKNISYNDIDCVIYNL